jgi:hypothetical protein
VVVVGRRPPDAESKRWGKGRVCEKTAGGVISRGRARAWAAQRSAAGTQHTQHKRGSEEDLAASSVARLWARAGKERRGTERVVRCARLGPSDVLCLCCAEPARTQAQRPTHLHLPFPLPFLGLSHADNSCELETLPLSRRCRTHSSWNVG